MPATDTGFDRCTEGLPGGGSSLTTRTLYRCGAIPSTALAA